MNALKRFFCKSIFTIVFLLTLPGFIYGEQNDEDEYKLEVMTVTADKREENIQEVPSAITAFTKVNL